MRHQCGAKALAKALLFVSLVGGLTAAGCGVEDEDEAEDLEPKIVIRVDPADSVSCPQGGEIWRFGPDLDKDGVLDDQEIRQSVVSCTTSTRGPASL